MINILNSLEHSVSEMVPLVRREWKHSHRAQWATESTKFQNNIWLSGDRQHAQSMARLSVTAARSITMFSTERPSRRRLRNYFNCKTNQYSLQCRSDFNNYTQMRKRNSNGDMMWTETAYCLSKKTKKTIKFHPLSHFPFTSAQGRNTQTELVTEFSHKAPNRTGFLFIKMIKDH